MLTLLALICILPFIHLLAMSFSSDEFTSKGVVFLLPKGFTLQAYKYLLQKNEFFTSLAISVMRVIFGTSASLIVVVLTAYPLSKTDGRFKGRTGFTWFFLVTMFLSGGLFATYFLYKQLGLLNSFLIYVFAGGHRRLVCADADEFFQRHSARYRRGGFIRQSGAIYHFV